MLFICLCFVHVCPFGRTDIGHVDVGYMEHCGSLNFLTDPSAGCKCLMPAGEFWKFVGSLIAAYVIYVPCPRGSSKWPSAEETEDVRLWSRFRGQGTGLPGSATCIDTDRTFFQALGSGLGVVEKRGGRGDQEGKAGKGQ